MDNVKNAKLIDRRLCKADGRSVWQEILMLRQTANSNQRPRRKRTGYETAVFDHTYTPSGGELTLDKIKNTQPPI